MTNLQIASRRLFAATTAVFVSAIFMASAIAPATQNVVLSGAIA